VEEPIWNRGEAIAMYGEIAAKEPEDTKGSLTVQIEACKRMYCTHGHEPALGRLSELANIDPARTKGKRRGQEAAAKLLNRLLSSVKVEAWETNMSDAGKPDFTDRDEMRRLILAKYCEFAAMSPEQTKGTLNAQIRACESLYLKFGYQPALQMLGEIANIDVSRTKGLSRGQEAAARLQKRFLNAIKVDKSGVQ